MSVNIDYKGTVAIDLQDIVESMDRANKIDLAARI